MTWSTKAVASSLLIAAMTASLAACAPSTDNATGGAASGEDFVACFATGGRPEAEWQKAQGEVAKALADTRGWTFSELSNNNDGPTAAKNVDIFIQQGCDAVMIFNAQTAVNPGIAQKLEAAGIPAITFDISQDGWYFVGIDNVAAGQAGGAALAEIAKQDWDCNVDLVLSAEAPSAGIVNDWRVGGMRDGVASICPDIPEDAYVSFEATGQLSVALPAARDVIAAHPNADHILVVGVNDAAVVGSLQAAEQLGRDSNIMGWGQDGSLITGADVNTHLKGSVFYFLEGYPVYAFNEILDKIAAGETVDVGDSGENPTVRVDACAISAKEAQAIPELDARVTALLKAAPSGTTEYELYCPTAS